MQPPQALTRGVQTRSELATALDVNASSVTRVCDVSVHKNLIRRRQPVGNRREIDADLTALRRRPLEQGLNQDSVLVEETLSRMSPQAKQRLARGLAGFADASGGPANDAWMLGWSDGGEDGDGEAR